MSSSIDMTKVKRHPYSVSFGAVNLGPLSGAPGIRVENKRHETRIYDSGNSEAETAVIVESVATVTVKTYNIATALELIAGFSLGDDVMAAERCRALVFTPVNSGGERTLTFPCACLMPELDYSPDTSDHEATLIFRARPDAGGALLSFE